MYPLKKNSILELNENSDKETLVDEDILKIVSIHDKYHINPKNRKEIHKGNGPYSENSKKKK